MRKLTKISHDVSVRIRYLYQDKKVRSKALLSHFKKYSKASIYRHAKRPIGGKAVFDKRKLNRGRLQKLTERDKRNILRQIPILRHTEGSSFTIKRLRIAAGVDPKVSHMTIRHCLYAAGYHYRKREERLTFKERHC